MRHVLVIVATAVAGWALGFLNSLFNAYSPRASRLRRETMNIRLPPTRVQTRLGSVMPILRGGPHSGWPSALPSC